MFSVGADWSAWEKAAGLLIEHDNRNFLNENFVRATCREQRARATVSVRWYHL